MSRYKEKKKNQAGRASITFIVVLLLVVMSVQIMRLYNKNQEYVAKEEILMDQYEEETERRDQINEYEDYIGSQEYVEDTARSKLDLHYDNEIVFKEE